MDRRPPHYPQLGSRCHALHCPQVQPGKRLGRGRGKERPEYQGAVMRYLHPSGCNTHFRHESACAAGNAAHSLRRCTKSGLMWYTFPGGRMCHRLPGPGWAVEAGCSLGGRWHSWHLGESPNDPHSFRTTAGWPCRQWLCPVWVPGPGLHCSQRQGRGRSC